jgi:hypothetical protein
VREIVPRPQRQHTERDACARELLGDETDGSIPAGCHDDSRPLFGCHALAHKQRRVLRRTGADDLDAVAATKGAFRRLAPFAAANASRMRVGDDESRGGSTEWGEPVGHRRELRRDFAS